MMFLEVLCRRLRISRFPWLQGKLHVKSRGQGIEIISLMYSNQGTPRASKVFQKSFISTSKVD
jgi:hypothetical protein